MKTTLLTTLIAATLALSAPLALAAVPKELPNSTIPER